MFAILIDGSISLEKEKPDAIQQAQIVMNKSSAYKYLVLATCLLMAACSGTRRLPPGEKLYTGAKVKIESSSVFSSKKKRFVKATANDALRPDPNKSFFGFRPKLCIYMAIAENPKTKFGRWIKTKGEPPVLLSSLKPGVTASIIDAKLFNIGIFKGYTDFKIIEKRKTAKVVYTSYVHKPYTVADVTSNITDDSLSRIIISEKEKSLIKPGQDYSLELLKAERLRIDALLKDKGYFYFNPDYLLFKADTSASQRTVTFNLTLKDSVPASALETYRINTVFIDQNFTLTERSRGRNKDTLMFGNSIFRGKESRMNIRPDVILQSVYLRKGEVYTRQNHIITLNRLMSMGSFKFVQVKFNDSDTAALGFLDVDILMTPMTNNTFRLEMDVVSKSNNFAGPRLNSSLLNRNTFRGAELLNLSMAGSYEAQLGGGANLYSYSVTPQVELTFPRFLVPFKLSMSKNIYVPKTRMSLSYSYLKRVSFFDMHTIQLGFGYKWRISKLKEHEFNPISLSFTTIRNQSEEFLALLNSNPFLKKSYEEQFIGGGNYTISYNEQILPFKRVQFYLQATAETAGNVFTLAKKLGGESPSAANPSTIAGSAYSQFAKLSVDARSYFNVIGKNKIALRLFVGAAKPYGNSSVLPYSKQFFSGGANSLRAFHINSVGPGTYFQEGEAGGFLQLGGDFKLEANAEYRFNIYRFFKGALFVDAGNIWLQKSNPANIGSPFLLSEFTNELAVGAGVGIRIDISFFLIRFDLAMPLRKPWLDDGHRWVTNQINFGDADWRNGNLVLNVAIGYPF
jgi:outer membrane protein assembly factor BamA